MSFRGYSARDVPRTPRSARKSIVTVQGKRVPKLIRPDTTPTAEEIGILKREKHNLIQEKSLLKAKIMRLIDITNRPDTYTSRSSADQNVLEKEYRQIEQISAAKRSEISQLNASDLAAVVNELQEECLMLHMELMRLVVEKKRIDTELKTVNRQLHDAKTQFHPDLEKKQNRIIKELERQITDQRLRNAKIRAKLDDKENEMTENKQDEAAQAMQKTIEDLEAQIKAQQAESNQVDEEIRQLEDEKRKEINELNYQLAKLQ